MKKYMGYIVAVLLLVLASVCLANEAFKGRVQRTATGGIMDFTNSLGRVGISSAFLSGSFSAGNVSTISVISGAATNVLVSNVSTNTVVWADEAGAVQVDKNEIVRFEWTESATPATLTFSSFAR